MFTESWQVIFRYLDNRTRNFRVAGGPTPSGPRRPGSASQRERIPQPLQCYVPPDEREARQPLSGANAVFECPEFGGKTTPIYRPAYHALCHPQPEPPGMGGGNSPAHAARAAAAAGRRGRGGNPGYRTAAGFSHPRRRDCSAGRQHWWPPQPVSACYSVIRAPTVRHRGERDRPQPLCVGAGTHPRRMK
jgi:hypothetical protein